MPLPLALAAAPQLLGGLYQWIKGNKELNKLHKQPVPAFSETPQMRASRFRAEDLAQGGYTPSETAAFRQRIAQDINTQSQRALDAGGGAGLGRVIAGMGRINTMGAEAKFGADDAALHRQNIHYADKFSQELQRIHDMNIKEQLNQRYQAERALGQGAQAGMVNAINAAGTGLFYGLAKPPGGDMGATMGATGTTGNAGGISKNILGKLGPNIKIGQSAAVPNNIQTPDYSNFLENKYPGVFEQNNNGGQVPLLYDFFSQVKSKRNPNAPYAD